MYDDLGRVFAATSDDIDCAAQRVSPELTADEVKYLKEEVELLSQATVDILMDSGHWSRAFDEAIQLRLEERKSEGEVSQCRRKKSN